MTGPPKPEPPKSAHSPRILRDSLTPVAIGDFVCLDAQIAAADHGFDLTCFFAAAPDRAGERQDRDFAGLVGIHRLGDSADRPFVSTANLAARVENVTLSLAGHSASCPAFAGGAGPFDGADVILGQRHRESAAAVQDWLMFHAAVHGASAAIVLNTGDTLDEVDLVRVTGMSHVLLLDCAGFGPKAPEVLYRLALSRYLRQAAGGAVVDVCDLIQPPADGRTCFSVARDQPDGRLPLQGRAVYPWRIRKGASPVFGDHICTPLGSGFNQVRVCFSQKMIAKSQIWTIDLAPDLSPTSGRDSDTGGVFDRHMCLSQPDKAPQQLIDKKTLFEDAGLVARATGFFDFKPVRAPVVDAAPSAMTAARSATGRTAIVTCMRNEGPFILEWLAYHRMIGVDDILVYTNDCTDGTDRLLDLLADRGLVVRRDNPFQDMGLAPQHAALTVASDEPVIRDADYVIGMDVDEFINIHIGQGHLRDLYGAVPDANMISMTWRLFGNSDEAGFKDAPVISRFTRCAPHYIRRPHQAWGFKTVMRNVGLFKSLGVHRPRGLVRAKAMQVNWVNGSGEPMPQAFLKTGWRSGKDSYGYDLVTLNHYAVRDAESFLVKRDRGRVNHTGRDQGQAYWFRMNNNARNDTSIQRHLPGLQTALSALLDDPEISAAHLACVDAHVARIRALRAEPVFDDLYQALVSARFMALSRMHHHFGMNVFLTGPQVIPDTVFDPALPEGFFFNCARPDG